MYPPPSIYAAVSCYMSDGASIDLKHSLMYYFLLDLRSANESKFISQKIKTFPIVFGMPKNLVKIIKASWYLDQKNTVLAIQKLSHPCVKTTDILPWQHHRIIKSFLCWKAPKKALKYINHMEPPQNTLDFMKLHLSILLACGAVTQGWEYQRKKQQEGYGNELMNHFFLGCQEMHKMKDLMYLPLNSLESSSLVKFLYENKDPKAQEYLVIYHLLHCNFFEAVKVNDKLSKFLVQKCLHWNETAVEKRTIDRGFLVENLMTAVSSIEKCLVEEMKNLPFDALKREDTLQPISISMKSNSSTKKTMTYSDILRSLICKDSPCGSNFDSQSVSKSRGYCIEDLPFLHPPVTPQNVRYSETLQTGSGVVVKRTLNSTSPTEFSSPAKKSRLLDNVPFMSSPLMRKTPKNLAGDIASLLQTPPIAMRTPNASSRSFSQNTPSIKPQSILKKKLPEHIKLNFLTCSTPSASEVESSDGEIAVDDVGKYDRAYNKPKKDIGEDNESKQIRFDLPEGEKSISDLSHYHESPHPGVFSLESPCKGETSDDSMQFESENALTENEESLSATKETPSVMKVKAAMEFTHSAIIVATPGSAALPLLSGDALYQSFEERLQDATSKADDSGVITVSNASAIFRFTASSTSDDLVQHSYSPVFPKIKSSCATPRAPLRQNFENADVSEDQGIGTAAYSMTRSVLHTVPLFSLSKSSPAQPSREESIFEQSDNEIFYSPCADNPSLSRTSFTFVEPVTLFPESSVSHYSDSRSQEYGIESGAGKDSEGSNETVILSNSDDSKDNTTAWNDDNSGDAIPGDDPIQIVEPAKPPRRTFVFAKGVTSKPVIEHSDPKACEEEPCQTAEESSVEAAKPTQRTVLFAQNAPDDASDSEETFKCPAPMEQEDFGEDTFRITEAPSVRAAKPPRRTFVFTKSVPPSVKKAEEIKVLPSTVKKNARASRRTFVFTKNLVSVDTSITQPVDEVSTLEEQSSESQSSEKTEFFIKEDAETYEEFSESLARGSSKPGTKHKADKKTVVSSPTVVDSISNPTPKGKSSSKSKVISNKKKEKSATVEKLDKMVGTTPKLSKKKTKGKSAQKMEFSFAEPHSPADSEILEALAKSPEPPLPSFMFSPPVTRGRLRKKRMDESMGSSFCSTVSEMSFTKPVTPPPVDPILEGIMQERSLGTKKKPRISSHPKSAPKRTSVRKSKVHCSDTLQMSRNLSPVREARSAKKSSPSPPRDTSLRHSMVLRQTKPKPDALF